MKTVRKLVLVVFFIQLIKFKDFHHLQKLFNAHPRLVLSQGLPEDKAEQLRAVQSVPFFPDFTRCYELLYKLKKLFMRVLEVRKIWDVVEIAKVRMNHLHHNDWVQRDIHLKGLAVFVTKFDEATKR